ncbi:hypothetical protein DPMN_104499 [Dreissena polymorpha]|uniref:Uncharacterized protein n=1 Tax=Dreissena polymorpha TaxID=45954 RepID=A0A9D4HAK9_DREPO|nr:hypothetical protein DPMN_104499 [Dreissena polymorpha]
MSVTMTSVCPICGSSDVVHLCAAYLEAKATIHQAKTAPSTVTFCVDQTEPEVCVVKSSKDIETITVNDNKSDNQGCEMASNTCDQILNEGYQKHVVIYLGSTHLDRRFPPQAVMPWVMAEVKRSRDTFKEVQLEILKSTLKAVAYEGSEKVDTVFEHNLHTLSRFAKTHADPRCFAYLRRQSLNSDFECHAFLAHDETVQDHRTSSS